MKKFFILLICLFSQTVFANDKLIVLLDWFINPDHAPLFVAQQQGFFKEENLDVEIIAPAHPSDPPKLVAAGKADIAITYQPQFLEQVDRGLPLIEIGELINQPLSCLLTLKNKNIHTLADLKNKKIGYNGSGANSVSLNIMLKHNGLTIDDVAIVNTPYDLPQALLAGKVDAIGGMMRNFELKQIQLTGTPVLAFLPEENGMPKYSELIFVANKKAWHQNKLQRFNKALANATRYLRSHPQEMWQAFAKQYPEANNTLNQQAWFATLPYFSVHSDKINKKEFMDFARFMMQNGLIQHIQPQDSYFNS